MKFVTIIRLTQGSVSVEDLPQDINAPRYRLEKYRYYRRFIMIEHPMSALPRSEDFFHALENVCRRFNERTCFRVIFFQVGLSHWITGYSLKYTEKETIQAALKLNVHYARVFRKHTHTHTRACIQRERFNRAKGSIIAGQYVRKIGAHFFYKVLTM